MKVLSMSCGVMPVAAAMSAFSWMFGQSTPARTKAPLDAAVYAALIDSLVRPKSDTLLVSDSTIVFHAPTGGVARWRVQFDSIPPDLPTRLEEISREVRATSALALPQPLRTISRAERREIFGADLRGGWEEFYRQFPKQRQYLEFSPVAFSADSSSALVYYQHHCGSRCGGGTAVWLAVRADGRWAVRKVVGFWAS
jgi:hypothetical protein